LILRYLRGYRGAFLLGLLCLLVTNAFSLSIPWLIKEAIEALRGATADLHTVTIDAGAIIMIAIALAFVRTWSRWLILGASRRIVYDIRQDLFSHLQTLPASFYGRHRIGEIMSRAVNDLMLIRSLFGPGVLNVLDVILRYAAGLTLMAWLDPSLTLLAVLPYPLLL